MSGTQEPADSQSRAASTRQGPQKILVAEDEHLLARNLCTELREMGFEVIGPAPNGQEAIRLARECRPDLALLDIRMPVVDGLAAGQTLYEELNIPVIILTAYSDPMYIESAARFGFFGYLLKPASLDELRASIQVAWSRHRDNHRLTQQVDDLETRLRNRKLVERAKGLLMQEHACSEQQAMKQLQKQSRDTRRPMADLAREILIRHGIAPPK